MLIQNGSMKKSGQAEAVETTAHISCPDLSLGEDIGCWEGSSGCCCSWS